MLKIEMKVFDPRLHAWGFPHWGSQWAAGLDLHACTEAPLVLEPQAPPIFVSTGMAFRIGDPDWAALAVPRSGLGHRTGLVLGNGLGLIDPDFDGPCVLSMWNRNPPTKTAAPITVSPGDRIAQLVFVRVTRPNIEYVDNFLVRSARGDGGYGSTGI